MLIKSNTGPIVRASAVIVSAALVHEWLVFKHAWGDASNMLHVRSLPLIMAADKTRLMPFILESHV